MFKNTIEQASYIKSNYPNVTSSQFDGGHWALFCDQCKVTQGFHVIKRSSIQQRSAYMEDIDFYLPQSVHFRCPVCSAYKFWILFNIDKEWFRLASFPAEGSEDLEILPSDPPSLRTAYREAIRSMNAGAYIASSAMFRRAVQVITRNVLMIKPGNLSVELNAAVGMEFNGIKISADFQKNGFLLKEAGNQASHPDKDPDLLDFSAQDAKDLQDIFMKLVLELWVIPHAKKKAESEFLSRRKIGI